MPPETRNMPFVRAGLLALGSGLVYGLVQRARQADVRGDVALVTGGSRGLGFLLARELSSAGCRVAICGRDGEQLERAQASLSDAGADVMAVPCDVADAEQVRQMVDQVQEALGPVQILVNNAGIIQVGTAKALSPDDYREAMDIMFWGAFHPTAALLPGMRQRRHGRIVNITSIGGVVSVPRLSSYAAAKFAAVGFSEGLSAELVRDGITVTTVIPGLMRTGSHLHAQFLEPERAQYDVFAPLASLPWVSIDAERAARRIVVAMRRGERELILSLPANLLARAHGLMPGTTTRALGIVNRLLPGSERASPEPRAVGMEVERQEPSAARDAITSLGRDAARRFLQTEQ
jgi:short-subunit dehydrogenase